MSKKQSTRPKARKPRRKARKPKFVEVEGHQLTQAQHADYLRCIESRKRTNSGNTFQQIEAIALSDFLHGYRPSHKITEQLTVITHEAMTACLAIGKMSDYMWLQTEPASIRAAGVELVQKLALELYNASAKLTAIAMNVKAEERTKLQHWLAQDEQLAQIGRGAEVAHG